jgi:hypothetical protein
LIEKVTSLYPGYPAGKMIEHCDEETARVASTSSTRMHRGLFGFQEARLGRRLLPEIITHHWHSGEGELKANIVAALIWTARDRET